TFQEKLGFIQTTPTHGLTATLYDPVALGAKALVPLLVELPDEVTESVLSGQTRPYNFNPRRDFRSSTGVRLEQHPLLPGVAGAVANPGGTSRRRTDSNHAIDAGHRRTSDL